MLKITLPPIGDEIFVQFILSGKQASPYIESGSLVFPAAEKELNYNISKNGIVIDPKTDIASKANHALYAIDSYMSLQYADGNSLVIVPHDTPLFAIGETGIYEYRTNYHEKNSTIHFNLFNNMWGTNFPQWIEGDFTYNFTLFAQKTGDGITQRANSLYNGVKINNFCETKQLLILPHDINILNVEYKDNTHFARIMDTSGKARKVKISAIDTTKNIKVVDFWHNTLDENNSDTIKLNLNPFEIINLKIC